MFCMTSIPAMLHAAWAIPRDALRLELLLATGAQDTSGNNRPITATGIAPTYQVDPLYGIPYAQFSGSGWLRVNTAWTAGAADDFSVSMWVKQWAWSFLSSSWELAISKFEKVWNGLDQYTVHHTYIAQPIFINGSWSTTKNSLRLLLDAQWKCTIRGNGISSENYNQWYNQTTEFGWASYRYDVYRMDYGNDMTEKFDCSKLIDNKWHNIVLVKKSWTISMNIDGTEIFKIAGTFDLGRDLLLGYSNHFSGSIYSGTYLSQSQINTVEKSHYSRSAMAWVRIYSRALSVDEIEALGDEYRYAQSDFIGIGSMILSMERYTKPNLTIQIKSIPLKFSKDLVEYQYSTDGTTFSGITSLSDISTSTGSITYRASMDLSSIPDGKVNVTLRIRVPSGSFSNLGTISFSKLDTVMNIDINQPNTDIAPTKSISASTDSGSVLYMAQTRWTVCDNTITAWEDYSDLTFAGAGDNGIRMCYKAVSPTMNKTIYKLSQSIQWIQSTLDQKNTNQWLFANYSLWNKGSYQKTNDSTYTVLDLFAVDTRQSGVNGTISTDINGDWLVDFLYSSSYSVSTYYDIWKTDIYSRRAIIINNGNYTFKTVYKCARDTINNVTAYYGDCADTTR